MFVEHRCNDFGMAEQRVPGDGVVTGHGTINGRKLFVFSQDFTVFGGSLSEAHAEKICKIMDQAMKLGAPVIGINDSGGARIQEGVASLGGYAEVFQRNVLASGLMPQISMIMGPCAGGAVYSPAMTDFIFMVKDSSYMFVTGPDVVKTVTHETVTAEDLGGADVHTRTSGVADHYALNDPHALAIARRAVGNLNTTKAMPLDNTEPREPLYDATELYGLIPPDLRQPMEVREVIGRIVDASEFDEFKHLYGQTLVTGFARIFGYPVGILANNGILFSESAVKGAHFIELCCQRKIPLIFLQNIAGFMVGQKYEAGGIAKDGAKLVTAVACAQVPKLTVIIGGSFGAGNYGMCGRAYSPRFLWMWPNARISVMGGEQAATVLATVRRDGMEKRGEDWSADDEAAFKEPILEQYEHQGHPYYASARLWDDGVIDPVDTRMVLGLGLSAALNAPIPEPRIGVFRM